MASVERAKIGAIGASTMGLAHCLILPLILAALPMMAAIGVPIPWFHRALPIAIVPSSGLACHLEWTRRQVPSTAFLGLGGIGALALSYWLGESAIETAVTVAGSAPLAAAYVINQRSRRCSPTRCDC